MPRVLENLARHGRHAAEAGDLFLARESQGVVDVPLAHDHDLAAAHRTADDRRDAADVEHGRGRDRRRLARRWRHAPGDDRLARRDERHVPEVRHHRPIGDERALGPAGGARGVHEHDRVVAVGVRDRPVIDGRTGREVVERDVAAIGAHADDLEVPIVWEARPTVGQHSCDALVVGEQHGHARVAQRVVELPARPPRIQRHHDRAVQRGAPERDDVFGEIPHRDPDPVARAHTEGLVELARKAAGASAQLAVRPPLVVVDDVHERLVRVAHREDVHDGARRAHEIAQRDAVGDHRLDLEGPARPDQRLQARVVAVHGRETGIRGRRLVHGAASPGLGRSRNLDLSLDTVRR